MRPSSLLAIALLLAGCGDDDAGSSVGGDGADIRSRLQDVYASDTGVDLRNDCFDARVMFETLPDRSEAEVLDEFVAKQWRVLPQSVASDVAADLPALLPELLAACSSVTGI